MYHAVAQISTCKSNNLRGVGDMRTNQGKDIPTLQHSLLFLALKRR